MLIAAFHSQLLLRIKDTSFLMQLLEIGFLFQLSSLLSTSGDEEHMLDDCRQSIRDLSNVSFRVCYCPCTLLATHISCFCSLLSFSPSLLRYPSCCCCLAHAVPAFLRGLATGGSCRDWAQILFHCRCACLCCSTSYFRADGFASLVFPRSSLSIYLSSCGRASSSASWASCSLRSAFQSQMSFRHNSDPISFCLPYFSCIDIA